MKHDYTTSLFFFFFFCLFSIPTLIASPHPIDVRGQVVSQDGEPLEAAVVTVRDQVSITDVLGYFTLRQVEIDDSLEVSYVGHETLRIPLNTINLGEALTIKLAAVAVNLSQVQISASTSTLSQTVKLDLATNPVRSSQEILRKVPGLFIAQHAGGGKAEQIFLRGFDIDHGTDITIGVDGVPVNMVSHAHGQGYSDLHFLIPETVEQVDFSKGPHKTAVGNFATAGQVNFITKDRIDNSMIRLEMGQFGTRRAVGMLDLLGGVDGHNLYVASEYLQSDGPFESPQGLSRINAMVNYSTFLTDGTSLSVKVSHFSSEWDASGQIPQRAVDSGMISRFGAIDDTEGGNTSRTSASVKVVKPLSSNTYLKSNLYIVDYDFELYSNFTFRLNNPDRGDQIRQSESRRMVGGDLSINRSFTLAGMDGDLIVGTMVRADRVDDVELSRTANRVETLSRVALGDVREVNTGLYTQVDLRRGKLAVSAGLRLDRFDFAYTDLLEPSPSRETADAMILSPKVNLSYRHNKQWQTYLKASVGFHSNDARTAILSATDVSGDILPAARGVDLGTTWKPTDEMMIDACLWILDMSQEFVYVGDEGIVEPSGHTFRRGLDLSVRRSISHHWYIDGDFNYTIARAVDEPEGEQFIPLAPISTLAGGISYQDGGFSSSIRLRHLMDRPANEDNTLTAEGFWVTDLNASYTWNKLTLGVIVENLFDVEWNEAQFATESRLMNEVAPVEEIHFTPGVPFFARFSVQYDF